MMLETLGSIFTEVITWVGEFVTALVTDAGALSGLLPLFLIGVSISIVMVCVRIVRKIMWGN